MKLNLIPGGIWAVRSGKISGSKGLMNVSNLEILGVDFSGAVQAGQKIWVSRAHFDGEKLCFDFLERAADLPGGSPNRNDALDALRSWICPK